MANETLAGSRMNTRSQWTIRSINGVPFPKLPRTVTHQVFVVDKDSYDDLDGNLQRYVLGERDKFIISFPMMYKEELEPILRMVRHKEFTVEYEDFWNSSIIRTGKFYHGDIEKSPFLIRNGTTLYEEQQVTLISYNIRKVNI